MSGGAKNRIGGLGRGLGALIPSGPTGDGPNPTDVYFGASSDPGAPAETGESPESLPTVASAPTEPPPPSPADADAGPRAVPGVRFAELHVEQIRANARQPRTAFDEDSLAELAHSIREFGMLQPVVVRADPDGADQDGAGYELVMGERRLRAARLAGLDTVPAIVRSTADDAMLRDALLENIHRAQLNPLEEAAAYQQLLEEFGTTHDELAQRIGRSRPQVSNTIRLLNLPVPVQRRVAAGVISAGHARALLGLDDAEAQEELATRIVAEGLSVRGTEEQVAIHVAGHGSVRSARSRRAAAAARLSAPAVDELANNLSDLLDTRVHVTLGQRKGRITVEFASIADLERIVGVIAPSLATQPESDGIVEG